MALEDFQTINPFLEALKKKGPVRATGLKRLAGLAARGLSLGMVGPTTPPEGLLEHGVELAGSIPTIAATTALASPMVAAGLRAARLAPTVAATRLTTAPVVGAGIGGVEAGARGEDILTGAATGAATFGGVEAGLVGIPRVLSRLRRTRPLEAPSTTLPAEAPVEVAPPSVPGALGEFFSRRTGSLQAARPSVRQEPVATTPGEFFTKRGAQLRPLPESAAAERAAIETTAKDVSDLPVMLPSSLDIATRRAAPTLPTALEVGMKRAAAPKLDDLVKEGTHVAQIVDPRGMTIYVPKTPLADEALQAATIAPIRESTAPPGISIIYKPVDDVVAMREPLLTSNVLKQADDTVEKLTQDAEAKLADIVSMQPAPAEEVIDRLITKSGLSKEAVDELVRSTFDVSAVRSGLSGQRMREFIAQAERAAEQMGLQGAEKSAFISKEIRNLKFKNMDPKVYEATLLRELERKCLGGL